MENVNFIYAALIGVLVYTFISFVILVLVDIFNAKNSETIAIYCATGVFGIITYIVFIIKELCVKLYDKIVYVSIIKDDRTKQQYKCSKKYYTDFDFWCSGYSGVKRRIKKKEVKHLPYVTKEMVEKAQINCDHCVYDNKECKNYNPLCKYDKHGIVNFDHFKKK